MNSRAITHPHPSSRGIFSCASRSVFTAELTSHTEGEVESLPRGPDTKIRHQNKPFQMMRETARPNLKTNCEQMTRNTVATVEVVE